MNRIDLTDKERLEKAEQEAVYWFRRASEAEDRCEQMAAAVRIANASNEKLLSQLETSERREAVMAELYEYTRKTGYQTSWRVGGITLEALQEEVEAAKAYKAPETVLKSDLVKVGGIAGGVLVFCDRLRTGTVHQAVYRLKDEPMCGTPKKTSGVKS